MKDIANKTDNVDELPANGFNSIVDELENAVTDSGQTLDASSETTPDPSPTQLSRAITEASQSADFYTDSGAADAYVLTAAGNWRQSTAYRNGQHFRFLPTNANTGASTINVSGLGVKTLENVNGTSLNANQLDTTRVALVYYDSSADKFKLIDPTFGQGAGGAVESYITNFGAEAGTEGWATYADAAAATPVDGTGGSPTVTWSRITDFPLVGIGSFLFTKDAVNRQGEGVSYAFVLPVGYRNQNQSLSLIFEVATGTYTDGDIAVFLYDIDGATLITPEVSPLVDAVNANLVKTTFVLDDPTSANYRFIIHQASTTTNGYTIRFDQFIVINDEESQIQVSGDFNYILNPDAKSNATTGVSTSLSTGSASIEQTTVASELPEEFKGTAFKVSASGVTVNDYAAWSIISSGIADSKGGFFGYTEINVKDISGTSDGEYGGRVYSNTQSRYITDLLTFDKGDYTYFIPTPVNAAEDLEFHLIFLTGSPTNIGLSGIKISTETKKLSNSDTDWEAYTPSNFQGFGTVSGVDLEWRLRGENLEIQGEFTTGTVDTSEAQLGLPTGYTCRKGSSPWICGIMNRDAAISDGLNYYGLSTAGDSFINFGEASSGAARNALSPMIGSLVGISERISVKISVPVNEGLRQLTLGGAFRQNAKGEFSSDAGQSIADNTWTSLNFEDTITDHLQGQWDGTTFTANRTGFLQVEGHNLWANAFSNTVSYRAFINGATAKKGKSFQGTSSAGGQSFGFKDLYVEAGQTVVFQVIHTEGVSRNRSTDALYNWIDINWTAEQTGAEISLPVPNGTIRLDTGNGHGATNTKIRRFTNVVQQGDAFTYADSGTDGMSITVNRDCIAAYNYSDKRGASTGTFGVSRNADGTVDVFSLPAADRLCNVTSNTNQFNEASGSILLAKGDIIRAHTDGAVDDTSNRCQFTIQEIVNLGGQ